MCMSFSAKSAQGSRPCSGRPLQSCNPAVSGLTRRSCHHAALVESSSTACRGIAMLIKIAKPSALRESDVTPESVYLSRRRFMGGMAGLGAGLALSGSLKASADYSDVPAGDAPLWLQEKISASHRRAVVPHDPEKDRIAPFGDASGYNNFYEFGTGKSDPARRAGSLVTEPWSLVVDGEVNKGGRIALEDLVSPSRFEERIYRLRCVEAWSMVIPWLGIPLAEVIKRAEPTSK